MNVMFSFRSVYLSSLVSATSNFKHVSSSSLYLVLVAIFLNIFSFTQSAKIILVYNIFSTLPLFLLIYVKFYMKNGGRLIYYIAQYKHFFFTCSLDYV